MEYEEYLRKGMWVDIELFKLESYYYRETNRTNIKFLELYKEIVSKNAIYLIKEGNSLKFYNNIFEKVTISKADKLFKEKLIKGNYYIKDHNGYFRLNSNLDNLIKLLNRDSTGRISEYPTFDKKRVTHLGYHKTSYMKDNSKGKGFKSINTPAFDCFMFNHLGTYNNTYALPSNDFHFHFINYENKLYRIL